MRQVVSYTECGWEVRAHCQWQGFNLDLAHTQIEAGATPVSRNQFGVTRKSIL